MWVLLRTVGFSVTVTFLFSLIFLSSCLRKMATLFQLAADDSATKRLDRARLQYENLLLSAGNTLSDNFHGQSPGLQRSMGEFSAAPTLSFPRMELPASPDRDDPLSRSVDHSRGSHSFAYNAMRSPIRSHAVEEMSGPTISNEEKSDVILSLQVRPSLCSLPHATPSICCC